MRKLIVVLSLPLLTMCLARVFAPSILFGFATLDFSFAIYGLGVLLSCLWLTGPHWQHIKLGSLLTPAALASFVFALIAIWSPTLWDQRATYLPLMDAFVALESAIILAVAASQKKRHAISILAALGLMGQLLLRKFISVKPAHAHGSFYRSSYRSS